MSRPANKIVMIGALKDDASERSEASHANGPPSREALRRGLAVALAEAETGIHGGKWLDSRMRRSHRRTLEPYNPAMIRVLPVGLGPIGAAIARQFAERKGFRIVAAVDVDPAKTGRDVGDVIDLGRKLRVTVGTGIGPFSFM